MSLRVGVDTGGTFTDLVAFNDTDDSLLVHKVSSTPDDPGRAILQGVDEILDKAGTTMSDIGYFAHGTTVGTNALLTGNGVKTGLITTRGFRDLLELGRGRRPEMYDPQADKPTPFVSRDLRLEVTERVLYNGETETPLDEEEVRAAVRVLRDRGVESIAVCFLYSFLVPDHERRVGEIIAEEFPAAYVSLSCDVLPEFREYERLSTVVTNAYVGPVVHRYLDRLQQKLRENGLRVTPQVTQSNGGVIPFDTAKALPVRLVLSGPSTGVVGAAQIGAATDIPDIITFDVGGTSSDISLVQGGRPEVTSGMELNGRPIHSPMLDILTVGAGGGSIAWIDSGGLLRVGPQSAGSFPGPACYGHGTEPTVTDANVVLQSLNPKHLLNGQMNISQDAARAAVDTVAGPLGLSTEEAALGILRVVTANMARALRVVSVQRGYDPREYGLVPFGGAGPLHSSRLARELGITTVLVPENPGAQSAVGLLMTDIKTDFMRTVIVPVSPQNASLLNEAFAGLEQQATAWFEAENVAEKDRRLVRRTELRYHGQNFELPVELPEGPITAETVEETLRSFERTHERVYGYYQEGAQVEAVTFRVEANGITPKVGLHTDPEAGEDPGAAFLGNRDMYTDAALGFRPTPVYDRTLLRPGNVVSGPAVIEQMDTTTVLLPGDVCHVDAYGNLKIQIGA